MQTREPSKKKKKQPRNKGAEGQTKKQRRRDSSGGAAAPRAVPARRRAAAAADWSLLPAELLSAIFGRLPLLERLGAASLVCSTWCSAAACVTSISVQATWGGDRGSSAAKAARARLQALRRWAAKRGALLASLTLLSPDDEPPDDALWPTPALRLPWAGLKRLRSLVLEEFVLPGGPLTKHTLGALRGLTRLELTRCRLDGRLLGSLTSLQRLQLWFNSGASGAPLGDAIAPAWRALGCLTHLTLAGPNFTQASCLAGLPERGLLELALHCEQLPAAALASCPLSLTSLELCGCTASSMDLTLAHAPRVGELTGLQALSIKAPRSFEGRLLAGLSGLTSLHLERCYQQRAAAVREVLAVCAAQPQLARLDLYGTLGANGSGGEEAVAPEEYAVLTAAPGLTYLSLGCCMLPERATQHIFAPGSVLPGLRRLDVGLTMQGPLSCHLAVDEVNRVLRCTPQLSELIVSYEPAPEQPSADELELSATPGLSLLEFQEIRSLFSRGGLRVLERLPSTCPSLRQLTLRGCCVSMDTLLTLPRCQQLTELVFTGCHFHGPEGAATAAPGDSDSEDEADGWELRLRSQAAPGCPPDVWVQLLDHAARNAAHVRAKLASARARVNELEGMLSDDW